MADMVKFYRRWLRWYPRSFREAYGPGMVQTFGERLDEARDGGKGRVVALVVRELCSVVVTALLQRSAAIAQDIRYTLRSLRNNPGFASVAVITCAIDSRNNTSVLSNWRGVVLYTPSTPYGLPVCANGQTSALRIPRRFKSESAKRSSLSKSVTITG